MPMMRKPVGNQMDKSQIQFQTVIALEEGLPWKLYIEYLNGQDTLDHTPEDVENWLT